MSLLLKEQTALKPVLSYTLDTNLNELLKQYKETVNPFFETNFSLSNAITEFTMGNACLLESKIVKKAELVNMLRKWISTGSIKFKLYI